MLDLPTWFWNTLAISVFIIVNVILWLHRRQCKKKGIEPAPPFANVRMPVKSSIRIMDILILAIALLSTITCASFIFRGLTSMHDLPSDTRFSGSLALSIIAVSTYSAFTLPMVCLLSVFQNNITLLKRLILLAICCVPLAWIIIYCITDNSRYEYPYLKLLLGASFILIFINWPAILLGKPFCEFFATLLSKIPLPYFQYCRSKE